LRVPLFIISVCVSAVLGLAALFVAKTVLPGPAAAKSAARQEPPGVEVVVAAKDMKYGDKIDADHLRLARMPTDAVPQGAFTTVASVLAADHGGAPVVLTPIAAREPILPLKISGPGARPSVAAEIGGGLRAYTIHVSDVTGVGGHALPGDRVDVVLMRDLNPMGPVHNFVSQLVLQNVRVLAIDLNADLASDKPATPSTATLEVTVEDSQKLAVAADLGKLSLALRRTGEAETADTGMFRTSAFGGGGGASHHHTASGLSVDGPIMIVYGSRHPEDHRDATPPATPAPAPAPPVAAAPAAGVAASLG